MAQGSKYSLELVDASGQLLADLTGRARGRKLTMSRNEAEEITWTLDLNEFERYARLQNQDPKLLLIPNSTEVRIRRGQKYLAGGQVTHISTDITPSSQTIEVRATGFLNLFKDRYTGDDPVTGVAGEWKFVGIDGADIAVSLINNSQAGTNQSFGVTLGNIVAVGNHDRTYRRTNVKDALQDLTRVQTNSFDFDFTYNKKFNIYTRIGSNRPELVFEYPRNIKSITVPNDATGMANRITALGSGFGEAAQAQVTVDDTGSQANYKVREKIITPNSVVEVATLTDHANAELAAWAYPFEIPSIEVDGNLYPYVGDYGIGDYVPVVIHDHRFLDHINTLYRIEKFDLSVDENDNESVKLYLSR